MTEREIKKLIDKYIGGTATEMEKEILDGYLDSFQDVEQWKGSLHGKKNKLQRKLYSRIDRTITNDVFIGRPNFKNNKSRILKMVAVILVVLGISLVLLENRGNLYTLRTIDSDNVVIELDDGTLEEIIDGESQLLIDSEGEVQGQFQKGAIQYQVGKAYNDNFKLRYNRLYVPFGKKIQLKLSDGTLVHLNSGSSLRYPVQFPSDKPREVYLEGEGYFEVAKDIKNNFIVHSMDIDALVYGTKFNISVYEENRTSEVVLLEGSLGVDYNDKESSSQKELRLVPNQMAIYNRSEGGIISKQVNARNYILWKEGKLHFDEETFRNILLQLQRHYNVSIVNQNESLGDLRFTGIFDTESIEQVLDVFSKYSSFKYKNKDGKIIIN